MGVARPRIGYRKGSGPLVLLALTSGLLLSGIVPQASSPPPADPGHSQFRFFLNPQSCGGSAPTTNLTLTIYNGQPTATGAYDQLLAIDWAALTGATSNLSNVEFTYPNGTSIQSWIETNATNSSTNSMVWVKLNSITALTAANIQELACPSSVYEMHANGPTGAYPNDTATYGQYDNGRLVFFDFYDNFSGTSCVISRWTVCPGSPNHVNNGIHFAASSTWSAGGVVLQSNPTFNDGTEILMEGDVGLGAVGGQPIIGYWNGLAGSTRDLSGIDVSGEKAAACVNGNCAIGGIFGPSVGTFETYIIRRDHSTSLTYANVSEGQSAVSANNYAGQLGGLAIEAGDAGGAASTIASRSDLQWIAVAPAVNAGENQTVTGYVRGFNMGNTAPLSGLTVRVAPSTTMVPSSTTATTGTNGEFNLSVGPGSWVVYSAATTSWGSASTYQPVTTGASSVSIGTVYAYPMNAYGNSTIVLPAWSCQNTYTYNTGNHAHSCQQPILSYTQDGVWYLNATDKMVFYSFANATVTKSSGWTPLYQNLMTYNGIENTEFMTEDGAWVYTFGCLNSLCSGTSHITVEALNTTTMHWFMYNFTTLVDSSLMPNTQVNMIGANGNSSTILVLVQGSSDYAYNVWNQTQWTVGNYLNPFEANNDYWIPSLDSFIDVAAQGSTSGTINQYRWGGTGSGDSFTSVWSSTYPTYSQSANGVQGVIYNATDHRIYITWQNDGTDNPTFYLNVGNNSVVYGSPVAVTGESGYLVGSGYPPSAYTNCEFDEHRVMLYDYGGCFETYYNGWNSSSATGLLNNSFSVNMETGTWYDTNITGWAKRTGMTTGYLENHPSPTGLTGEYVNNSYSIENIAYDGRDGLTVPINGGFGQSAGTIWWTWKLGLPRFPVPSASPIAQTKDPAPVSVTNSTTATSITLNWPTPASGATPLVNWTVLWGNTATALYHNASLYHQNRSYTITGLTSSTKYYWAVISWNLHWHAVVTGSTTTASSSPPSPPTGVTVTGTSSTTVSLSWTNPAGVLTGDLVFHSFTCSGGTSASLGVQTSYTVTGLLSGVTYCFWVEAENSNGASAASNQVVANTTFPAYTLSVAVKISNTQASPTGTYQQMVVVNSSRYSAYLNSNDSNVEWRYPNGTAINAWMESNNSNASTRTTWWLKLYSIAANSNQTVYMDVYGKTDYLLSVFGPTGEAPQLSSSYGALDDGAMTFTRYWNFS
ncbi:MAG: DUF2341 domain-containing protein, partial [Euryarchaeota archaeon]|nr:DUF2341 domain-containing protein [Euryarchaeota archaeon]